MFRKIERYEERALGLPYPVILENAAEELLDEVTGERIGVRIPNLEGLAAAVAVVRCLCPLQLCGAEVRFIRRVLDMTQEELANALELDAKETISRWENDARPCGGYVEKLLRYTAINKLGKRATGLSADKDAIGDLKIVRREHMTLHGITASLSDASSASTKEPVPEWDPEIPDCWDMAA